MRENKTSFVDVLSSGGDGLKITNYLNNYMITSVKSAKKVL